MDRIELPLREECDESENWMRRDLRGDAFWCRRSSPCEDRDRKSERIRNWRTNDKFVELSINMNFEVIGDRCKRCRSERRWLSEQVDRKDGGYRSNQQ
jgi:hypothetical protein